MSHNTILSYTSALQKWIVPRFGAMAMGEIGTGDMAEFLREHDKLGQHERTKKLKAILSALFQVAAEDKSVPRSRSTPSGDQAQEVGPLAPQSLSREEYAKFLVELDEHWHLLCDFIVGSGLRWEEAMGLKKGQTRAV